MWHTPRRRRVLAKKVNVSPNPDLPPASNPLSWTLASLPKSKFFAIAQVIGLYYSVVDQQQLTYGRYTFRHTPTLRYRNEEYSRPHSRRLQRSSLWLPAPHLCTKR